MKKDCSITKNFLEEYRRMCKSFGRCAVCPLNKLIWDHRTCSGLLEPSLGITQVVQKWSNENPVVTLLDKFLENYPKAFLKTSTQTPRILPCELGLIKQSYDTYSECNVSDTCDNCWNKPAEVSNIEGEANENTNK